MKKFYISIITLIVLSSCGGDKKNSTESVIEKGDLKQLRTKRTEIVTQADALNKELELIDDAISKLDVNHKLALITTITAKDTIFNHYLELQANVQTKENIVLNAEYGGTLLQVYVTEGQKVTKGQTLAKIDDGGLSQQLSQLEIQANLAKTTFERQQNLWNQKIGSEIQYLQAKSSYEAQSKAVAQMRNQLSKTTIRAPFSGTIDDVISEKGSVVGPGTPIVRIVSLNNMYLEAEVPEKYVSSIKKGSDVIVDFPILGESLDTKISQAGNYINPGNRSFMIQINVPNKNGKIKPNLSGKIKIKDYTNPNSISVPLSIISENAEGEQYLYIAENATKEGDAVAKKIIIKTGKTQGNLIEVLEGVKDGDLIIKEGARSVKDGQKVTIIK
ncbi:efflux RND transporter periplasmic adaptor subunit [Flavobacterium sediminilitoris]|uniref:Efflux RND transporter periplasmic adaptor subunit n=1 Tax=Flavobacterium sediminilitoris TaxID=2024526 RepID=A0ABY4HRJ3_9FLAO|nr:MULTISPECIES: efflux RND transporter periplasmic adaptor subunit [Flavobacterium]UOX35183.1 efflux RND transporter periplasmic adaptor subunit [Flavobacterium sediminilitoris]